MSDQLLEEFDTMLKGMEAYACQDTKADKLSGVPQFQGPHFRSCSYLSDAYLEACMDMEQRYAESAAHGLALLKKHPTLIALAKQRVEEQLPASGSFAFYWRIWKYILNTMDHTQIVQQWENDGFRNLGGTREGILKTQPFTLVYKFREYYESA